MFSDYFVEGIQLGMAKESSYTARQIARKLSPKSGSPIVDTLLGATSGLTSGERMVLKRLSGAGENISDDVFDKVINKMILDKNISAMTRKNHKIDALRAVSGDVSMGLGSLLTTPFNPIALTMSPFAMGAGSNLRRGIGIRGLERRFAKGKLGSEEQVLIDALQKSWKDVNPNSLSNRLKSIPQSLWRGVTGHGS